MPAVARRAVAVLSAKVLQRQLPVAVPQQPAELLQPVGEVDRSDRRAVASGPHADLDVEFLFARQVIDFRFLEVDAALQLEVVPCLLHGRAKRVAQLLRQRDIRAGQPQRQAVSLRRGHQRALARELAGVVAARQVAEGPPVVEHLQRAADVADGIGEVPVTHRAAVQGRQEVPVHGLGGLIPPKLAGEAERPARLQRADHRPGALRHRVHELLVHRNVVATGLQPAVGAGEGPVDLRVHADRLSPAVAGQTGGQHVLLQLNRPLAALQPVGKLLAGKGHAQAADRHLGVPARAVVGQVQVGMNLTRGEIAVPLRLKLLVGEEIDVLGVQVQIADFGLQPQRALGVIAFAPARQLQLRLAAAGKHVADFPPLVVAREVRPDVGQRVRQAGVVQPGPGQLPGDAKPAGRLGLRIVAHVEVQASLPPERAQSGQLRRQLGRQDLRQLGRNVQPFDRAAHGVLRAMRIDQAGDFDAAEHVGHELGGEPAHPGVARCAAVSRARLGLRRGRETRAGHGVRRGGQRAGDVAEHEGAPRRIDDLDRPGFEADLGRPLAGAGERQEPGRAPGPVVSARVPQRPPADDDLRDLGLAFEQLLDFGGAGEKDLFQAEEFAGEALDPALAHLQPADEDSLALHEFCGADRDLQVGLMLSVVFRQHRLDAAADLLVHAATEVGKIENRPDQPGQQAALQEKPDGVDQALKNQGLLSTVSVDSRQ